MTNEDKKLIAGYMGWKKAYLSNGYHNILYNRPVDFDLNDAGLCVQEMQKRGEWWNFLRYANTSSAIGGMFPEQFIALLFNPDNFFTAMAQWIKEGKK